MTITKYRLTFFLIALLFLNSCGWIFKQGIENAVNVVSKSVIPDTCDLKLVYDLEVFRRDSLRFPGNAWIHNRLEKMSDECRESFDSLNIITYGSDSADLFITKKFSGDNNESYFIRKYYRYVCPDDTTYIISPHIITSGGIIAVSESFE